MRGLKHEHGVQTLRTRGRIFYRCVDWNKKVVRWNPLVLGRIFYRCVDWNHTERPALTPKKRRIFYRCVDWNVFSQSRTVFKDVASFTDAWIETSCWCCWSYYGYVASFTDAWIETKEMRHQYQRPKGRIFYRCVDWNLIRVKRKPINTSRIFYRCVDWNPAALRRTPQLLVASFTDAWIETSILS